MAKARTGLLTLSTWALAACAGGNETEIRQSTPEETAYGYKQAVVDQDWERSFVFLTRKAQESMVGGAFLTAAYGAQADTALANSYAKLADKYGLLANDADQTDHDDLAGIFVEIAEWTEDNLPAEHGGTWLVTVAEQMAVTEFTDFVIDGDRARAKMVHPENTRDVSFKRIDGRWYID